MSYEKKYVFLYDGETKTSNLVAESGQICVPYDSYKLYSPIDIILEMDLSVLKEIMYVRFGASGNFDDDWKTNYREYKIIVMGE